MADIAYCPRCKGMVEDLDIQEDGTCWYCEPDEEKKRAHGKWVFSSDSWVIGMTSSDENGDSDALRYR